MDVPLFSTASLSGILAHQAIFKRFEVDTHPVVIGVVFLGAPFAIAHGLKNYVPRYADSAQLIAFLIVGCFLLSLLTSILVYRALFHPLRDFPGPFSARLSKLWALTQAVKSYLKWYQVDAELHQKYGDYVRTGRLSYTLDD